MGFGSWKGNRGDGIMGLNGIWVLEGEWRGGIMGGMAVGSWKANSGDKCE